MVDTTSTIECINTIGEETIRLRVGFHKSMDRVDNVFSAARGETEFEMTTVRLKVKLKGTSSKGHGYLINKKLATNRSIATRTFVESHENGRRYLTRLKKVQKVGELFKEEDFISRASWFTTSSKILDMLHS